MRSLGAAAQGDARAYFTGGVSAVLMGWREATIDVDLTLVPERDEVLRSIPALKEELELSVELASPAHFLPELNGAPPGARGVAGARVSMDARLPGPHSPAIPRGARFIKPARHLDDD